MNETETYKKMKNLTQNNFPEYLIVHHTGGTDADPLTDTSHHTAFLLLHSAKTNLVGWWRMGEGASFATNWSIPDDSTNNNTGTSVNMEEADRVTNVP